MRDTMPKTTIAGAAALLLLAGSALGQTRVETRTRTEGDGQATAKARAKSSGTEGGGLSGSFEQPLGGSGGHEAIASSDGASVFLHASQSDGDDTYEITVKDGEVSAKVNGKAVPEKRIRRSDGRIEILGDDGEVLATFNVGQSSIGTGSGQFKFFGPGGQGAFVAPFPGQPGLAGGLPADWTPPKVMLGVTMSDPSEALRAYLELDEGNGIVLDRVIEELPAARAGLKKNDVIVKVEGLEQATQEKLRELLRSKEPGDEVRIGFLRKGAERSATIRLEAYDQEKLGAITLATPEGTLEWKGDLAPKGPGAMAIDPEWWKQLQLQGEDAAKLGEMLQRFQGPNGEQLWMRQHDPMAGKGEGGWQFFTPGGGAGASDDRVADLSARMEALDKRLADLADRLERLQKALEKSGSGR